MIEREHDLPVTKQAKVLRISRGSVYYRARPVSATDLEVMRRLDRLHQNRCPPYRHRSSRAYSRVASPSFAVQRHSPRLWAGG